MAKKPNNINWEKISVYIACLGFIFLLWNSQSSILENLSFVKERIARLETKVENLEKNK